MLKLEQNRIETERLILRPPTMADAPRIAELANHREIAEMLGTMPNPYALSDAHEWIKMVEGNIENSDFAITLRGSDRFTGACGYRGNKESGEVILGYWLGMDYWGKGYATEAARAVVAHAFGISGHEALDADFRTSNGSSGRVLEKLGFRLTGKSTCFSLAVGKDCESFRLKLERQDWLEQQRSLVRKETIQEPKR